MADFDLIQTGQEVQNILTGAAMQTYLTAENERAEQAEQTLQGNIDAEETRAKAAEKQNADDIDVIESKIPAGASDQNQLADKEFVNSSIATATATYRGAYNEVSDLSLTVDATHEQIAAALAGAISTADNNDYCFVQIPTADATPTQIAAIERYKFNGTAWAYEYTLNNSGFTAAQWAALNSGITSGLVAKLSALPTNEALTLALAGKQDVLTFDSVPVDGSNNPVKSGGIYSAIDDEATRAKAAEKANADDIDDIETMIPAAASNENQLADKQYVNDGIATASATYRGAYNEVSDLSLTVDATHEQIAAALAGAISTADNNDYCFVQIPTADATPSQIAAIERYKFNGTAWAYEYTLNNSGFTADQWAALNSGITSGLVAKLSALPTNEALTLALAGKQNVLTFDNAPVDGSNNPVKSGGVYSAIDAEATTRAAAIAAIVALIPEAASALNQLADKAFVNSSISTATAVFKGTFNVVVDLELNYNASQQQIAIMLASKIISADNNDYCFVQIPTSNETPLEIARTDRYKFNDTAWAYEYTLNNSGFTAAQWAAINSGITSLLKDKLIDLPTATELTALLAAKQNQLTFDTTPTTGSTNPVTSGGIKSAIDTEKTRAEAAEADRYTKSETYNKTEINGMVSTPHQNYVTVSTYASLPSSGQSTDTIYRVSSYDGANNQVDDTVYSEYAWDGTQYVFLCVKSQIEEVFDITVYNNNTKYADLSAALGVDGANIPSSLRRGGMSVKFVQSSDNNYVQFLCMVNAFTTDVTQWQGVTAEIDFNNKNIPDSDTVEKAFWIGDSETVIDLSNYTELNCFIDATQTPTVWFSSSNYKCKLIPITQGMRYVIRNTRYALLTTNDHTSGSEPSYAAGYSKPILIKDGDEVNILAPTGAMYLFVATKFGGNTIIPYVAIYNKHDIRVFDNEPTAESDNPVKSDGIIRFQDVFDVNQTFAASTGGYSYDLVSGNSYEITNNSSSDGVLSSWDGTTRVAQIAVNANSTVKYIPSSTTHLISIYGATLTIKHLGRVTTLEGNISDINTFIKEDVLYTEIQQGEVIPYKTSVGHHYWIRNTGTVQTNVYYKVSGADTWPRITSLAVGELYEYTPSQAGDYINISDINGSKITICEKMSIYGQLTTLNDEPVIMNVCTYNTGDFTGAGYEPGSNELRAAYRKLLSDVDANLIGTQEDCQYFGTDGNVRTELYGMFKNYYRLKHTPSTQYLAFCSDYHIQNIHMVSFVYVPTEETPKTTFDHGDFMAGEICLNDKVICVISFHLDWSDKFLRAEQAEQIRAYAKNYNYALCIGDTNPNNYINGVRQEGSNDLSSIEWPVWAEDGFTMTNKGYFGAFDTYYGGGCVDNIFVLGGTIKKAWNIEPSWGRDHYPMCCKVVF